MDLLIADDQSVFRAVLRRAIEERPGAWRVREADDGERVLELCKIAEPDVVFLDVRMPKLGGLATLRLLRHRHPAVRVILVSMYDDQELIREAMRLGALAYVVKDDAIPGCVRALDLAMDGKHYLSPRLTKS